MRNVIIIEGISTYPDIYAAATNLRKLDVLCIEKSEGADESRFGGREVELAVEDSRLGLWDDPGVLGDNNSVQNSGRHGLVTMKSGENWWWVS